MPHGEATARLGAVLSDLHRLLRRATNQRTNRSALPDAQVELMLLVGAHPGVSVKEAAGRLRTAPNTVSTLVRDLVTAGLIERERDPVDGRVARLRVTPAARNRMADYDRHRTALLTEALSQLDPDARAAVEDVVPHLDRLAALLRAPS
ncbi:MarR family winged helix-turn-helix transcriptional regulator [Micromonospora costi]|uniref:MarR family transcriptional regulator n=1 Tax=Micromonospora costi TaxID=1530042 RepID=A0A3B0A849_9ACTN|nr:MarR family winged helix-turn-helix transcriptional regulator [Micromonospora costi]RKN56190.1 MarR family transcriptional regulator [Micromonospora costi]